ncbi:uncharacterized protein E0L32_006326 [Thyridium curvatum]|uniref:Uncharacterized protein n=1 Tax=Thyridium curvatum TaxID=1093900 RepID=A0A507B0C8_9PEZI|nr:uncharacterized protein E0L32_006326 [Thyridium curvatum]TPX13353.1 hypothetical protein E0L32_006326 [Thyridium curvatum]
MEPATVVFDDQGDLLIVDADAAILASRPRTKKSVRRQILECSSRPKPPRIPGNEEWPPIPIAPRRKRTHKPPQQQQQDQQQQPQLQQQQQQQELDNDVPLPPGLVLPIVNPPFIARALQLPRHHQQRQQLQQIQLQQQTQPIQMNGLNGGGMPGQPGGQMPGGGAGPLVGLPTPAGHQAELNYIHAMVEELSRQLAENKKVLEDVVTGVGRVRNRARAQAASNEELIATGADEVLNGPDSNMDAIVSLLTEALDKAKYSRDANAALLQQYATALSAMLRQFHEYKQRHVADVAAWHRSYREQLADARDENCRLRSQIWEMQRHAGLANESLRRFRGRYDDSESRWERRVDARAVRQELRFWKRMAMPEVSDDDPCWSDDDDLVDPVEKMRLGEHEKRMAQEQMAMAAAAAAAGESGGVLGGGDGAAGAGDAGVYDEEEQSTVGAAGMGGVAMQRDDAAAGGMPVLPPRPSSAASTGSSGQ